MPGCSINASPTPRHIATQNLPSRRSGRASKTLSPRWGSKTCLVRFDNNKFSVAARAVGRPVEVHAYADRIVIRQDGRIVAEHPRSFSRGDTLYDPWHYVPVPPRNPGGLRGARAQ